MQNDDLLQNSKWSAIIGGLVIVRLFYLVSMVVLFTVGSVGYGIGYLIGKNKDKQNNNTTHYSKTYSTCGGIISIILFCLILYTVVEYDEKQKKVAFNEQQMSLLSYTKGQILILRNNAPFISNSTTKAIFIADQKVQCNYKYIEHGKPVDYSSYLNITSKIFKKGTVVTIVHDDLTNEALHDDEFSSADINGEVKYVRTDIHIETPSKEFPVPIDYRPVTIYDCKTNKQYLTPIDR
jgi:hypothetical protein